MDPTQTQQEEREAEEQQQRLTAAAHQVQATLTAPLPDTPPLPAPSSNLSEMAAQRELLQVVVARVDQVARVSQEQWQGVSRVMDQVEATMQLEQEMIAQQDQQVERLRALGDKLELTASALVKINANLSEIVAALLTDQKA